MVGGKEEQRGVVRFWTAEGGGGARKFIVACGLFTALSSRLLECHKRFLEGCVTAER